MQIGKYLRTELLQPVTEQERSPSKESQTSEEEAWLEAELAELEAEVDRLLQPQLV